MRGFTLTEVLVIIGVFFILITMAIPALRFFERESDLNNSAEEITNALRLAQNKTLASEGESSWGVYFSTSTSPQRYTLFKGLSFASRDISFDKVNNLSQRVEIYEINLAGGQSEIVFNRISGETANSGNVSLRLKSDISKTREIIVQASGRVLLGTETSPADGQRIKDSRHVHLDYNRSISIPTERIILTFDGAVIQEIIIANNLKNSQIFWEGEVLVSGEAQELKIHTHRLNNPDTQWSFHRDRRYNTKALKLEISGDTTGNLIQYAANGQTATGTSIYVTGPTWQ